MGPLDFIGLHKFGINDVSKPIKNRSKFWDSQEAQKNAAANTVEGLKRAGLSPALAAGMPQAASDGSSAYAERLPYGLATITAGGTSSKIKEQAQTKNRKS